ncbi:MAG: hypothetical protein ACK4Z0_08005, partial [Sphingomonadaceae bacterium]
MNGQPPGQDSLFGAARPGEVGRPACLVMVEPETGVKQQARCRDMAEDRANRRVGEPVAIGAGDHTRRQGKANGTGRVGLGREPGLELGPKRRRSLTAETRMVDREAEFQPGHGS